MPQQRTPQDTARRAVIADAAAGRWREHERRAAADQPGSIELDPGDPGCQMTIRVYTVTRNGLIKEDTGTRVVLPAQEGTPLGVEPFPPCTCPRCRAGRAVSL